MRWSARCYRWGSYLITTRNLEAGWESAVLSRTYQTLSPQKKKKLEQKEASGILYLTSQEYPQWSRFCPTTGANSNLHDTTTP